MKKTLIATLIAFCSASAFSYDIVSTGSAKVYPSTKVLKWSLGDSTAGLLFSPDVSHKFLVYVNSYLSEKPNVTPDPIELNCGSFVNLTPGSYAICDKPMGMMASIRVNPYHFHNGSEGTVEYIY